MKRIAVAHVVQAVGGGVEMAIRRIVESIDDGIFESIIVAPYQGSFLTKSGKPVRVLTMQMVRDPNFLADVRALRQLIRILQQTRPDIVHCHSAKGGFIGRLGARLIGLPTLYTPNAFSYLSQEKWTHRAVFLGLERLARSWTNLLVAASRSEAQLGVDDVGFRPESITIFENAVPDWVSQTKPHGDFHFSYICSIGRPSYQKNIELLLDAYRIIKERGHKTKCILLSSGYAPLMKKVTEEISKYGLEDEFIILENLSNMEALQILSGSECFVLSSRYEGLPISVIEAMALAKPIVATDVIGTRDCIVSGQTGLLVIQENAEELAVAIEKVLTNKDLRRHLSKSAHIEFVKRFCLEKNIGVLENVYLQMIKD